MKISTISELLTADDGFVPEAVKANIDKVFDVKEGEGAKGSWKLQPAIIKEGEHTMRVVFSGRQTYMPDDIVGTEIYSRCKRKKDGSLMGMKLRDNEYQGKVTKELFIYRWAEVSFGDEPNSSAGEDEVPFEFTETETTAEPVEEAVSVGANDNVVSMESAVQLNDKEDDAVLETKKAITKSANLMLVCMDAARWTVEKYQEKHGESVPPEQFQAICSTLFINADKRGLVNNMPTKPVS
tara:strand:- start:3938 stop:4654 length:717 start_codon:yes stop_codon:yes gene_type:complete